MPPASNKPSAEIIIIFLGFDTLIKLWGQLFPQTSDPLGILNNVANLLH
jgi:hypothetical protein